MSIPTEEIIAALLRKGALVEWNPPLDAGDCRYRRLLLRPGLESNFELGDELADDFETRVSRERSLKSFITGESFETETKCKNLDTSQGYPDRGIWELRFLTQPQARLIGGFCDPLIFVGIAFHLRKNLGVRVSWGKVKADVELMWNRHLAVALPGRTGLHKLRRVIEPARPDLEDQRCGS